MLHTARLYLHSSGQNTGMWRTDGQTNRQTDRQTESLWLLQRSALRAMRTCCNRKYRWMMKSFIISCSCDQDYLLRVPYRWVNTNSVRCSILKRRERESFTCCGFNSRVRSVEIFKSLTVVKLVTYLENNWSSRYYLVDSCRPVTDVVGIVWHFAGNKHWSNLQFAGYFDVAGEAEVEGSACTRAHLSADSIVNHSRHSHRQRIQPLHAVIQPAIRAVK